jgi:hypothetical protein
MTFRAVTSFLQRKSMKTRSSFSAAGVAYLLATFLAGCGGGSFTPPPPSATHLAVNAPSSVTAGTAFNFSVTALDASNSIVASYSDTVEFGSSDTQAMLPSPSKLLNGTRTFSATLKTTGNETITAIDTARTTITGRSSAIQISPAPQGFTVTGAMQVPRHQHTATLLSDGRVLVTGGSNSTGTVASAEVFDPSTDTFSPTGSMTTARAQHTATLLKDGRVLVAGGSNSTGTLASSEIFDPSTNTFVSTVSMANARFGHTAALLNSGKVLVAGGIDANGKALAGAELFDPQTGQFTAVGNMAVGRSFHTATLLSDGKVLIAGGSIDGGTVLGELFDPATATFSPTANGGPEAAFLAAASLRDGRVFLTGGEGDQSFCGALIPASSLANVNLFGESSATFSATSSMVNGRARHTATLLSGGEVLIAGGASISVLFEKCPARTILTSLASAETFDPTSGTFALTDNMTTSRYEHTATLLGNGKVLLVGGVDANGNVLASAELFQ